MAPVKINRVLISVFMSLMLVTGNVFAYSHNATSLYLRAGGGINHGAFDLIYNDETDIYAQNIREAVNQYGYLANVGLGYIYQFNANWHLGAEFNINLITGNAYYASGAATAAFKDRLTYNGNAELALLADLSVADGKFVYGKAGVAYASVAAKLKSPAGYTPTYQQSSQIRYPLGLVFGLGYKQFINPCLAIFIESNYQTYNQATFHRFENFTATYSHSALLNNTNVLAGVQYYLF